MIVTMLETIYHHLRTFKWRGKRELEHFLGIPKSASAKQNSIPRRDSYCRICWYEETTPTWSLADVWCLPQWYCESSISFTFPVASLFLTHKIDSKLSCRHRQKRSYFWTTLIWASKAYPKNVGTMPILAKDGRKSLLPHPIRFFKRKEHNLASTSLYI